MHYFYTLLLDHCLGAYGMHLGMEAGFASMIFDGSTPTFNDFLFEWNYVLGGGIDRRVF